MHYTVVVIFPMPAELFSEVKQKMSEDGKVSVDQTILDFIEGVDNVAQSDTDKFLPHLEKYTEKKAGRDEQGYYLVDKAYKMAAIDMYRKKLEKPFGKFDFSREVKEYKYYLSKNDVDDIAKHYQISAADQNAIAAKIGDWNGDKGGVDERGIYALSTQNRNGHFDSWGIMDAIPMDDFLSVIDEMQPFPQTVFTPDCQWVDAPEYFFSVGPEDEKAFREWQAKVKEMLGRYKNNSVAVLID
ncbi:MAG: hypothetical protein MUD10_04800, partial [Candidatus Pacebacteria bacterium]|nr:hypothetical protein [Candidatus Paceibacterota bacterium]